MLGHSLAWTPTVDPWWLLPVQTPSTVYWVYANATDVYVVDQSGTSTEISRTVGGNYAADFQIGWNGGILNSIPVLNNGVDVPQMWNPQTAGTALVALTAWPAGYQARVVRPLRNFLVALDITKSGTRYPHNILWSHSALPGAVPSSWDTADATKDAGEVPVAETPGVCIDLVPLRDVGIVYKEDSTWIMQHVGGTTVFKLSRLSRFGGLLSRNCARPFNKDGEKHFAVTKDDVMVHDGQNTISVIDGRMRRWLFNQIDSTNYQRTHVFINATKNELGIAIPTGAQCTVAALWNYKTDRWGIRELPSVNYVESGIINPTAQALTWDTDGQTWDSDTSTWDERTFGPVSDRWLMGVPGASRSLFMGDDTNQFNGVAFTSYVERVGLAIIGQDREGNPKYDLNSYKLCTEIWPRVEAIAGTVVQISVASQNEPNDPIAWTGPFVFTVGTDKKVNPMVGGKLLGVKFAFPSNAQVKFNGFDMELVITGKY